MSLHSAYGRTTIMGGGRLRGLGDWLTDVTASAGDSSAASVSVPSPSSKPVAISPGMSYQQRLDYAEGGYSAMQLYIDTAALLFDDAISANLQAAQDNYATAYHDIARTPNYVTPGQLDELRDADAGAAIALAPFKATASHPAAPAAVAKAAATIPPAGHVTAATLAAAQSGGLGTLGWLAVGIAAVVFGPKVYHSIFGK